MRVSSLGKVVPWGRLTQSAVDRGTSLPCWRERMLGHSVVSDCLWIHGLYRLPGSSVHRCSREKYRNGLPCPSPGDLPDPGIKPTSHEVSCIGRWVLYHVCHLGSPEVRARHILSTLNSLVSSYYPEYIAGSTNMSLNNVKKRKKKNLPFLNAN